MQNSENDTRGNTQRAFADDADGRVAVKERAEKGRKVQAEERGQDTAHGLAALSASKPFMLSLQKKLPIQRIESAVFCTYLPQFLSNAGLQA